MAAPSPDEAIDTAALGRSLVDTFGKGWAKQDIDLLGSVFADEALFRETPFAQPRTGIGAIREYWRDIGYHQSEGRFSSGEVFTVGPWFSAEFKFVFRRRRTGEWVDARGALFCETRDAKITEMRMYWHRWAGGREIRQD